MKRSIFTFFFMVCFISNAQMEYTDSLSAKEAVIIALKNNYDIQISNAQVDIAAKNNSWSEAGLYPTVTLNVAYNNSIQDNSNNPFTFTPGLILFRSLSPNLSFNMNLFSGFAVKISKARLNKLEEQSNGNAMLVIESIILDVLKAYYGARVQFERLVVLNKLKSISLSRYEFYKVKEKYASSTSLEGLQFKNQYFSDSTNALVQELSYKNAVRNLYLLMNNKEVTQELKLPFLTDSLNINFPLIDFEEAKNSLKTNNQQLKNQFMAIELQQLNTSFQKSFLYPTLSLQGGFIPSKNWFEDLNDPNMKINTEVLVYNGSINLRYSIFNNWKNKRAVEVSKIQESIAELNYKNMEKSVTNALANLIDSYQGNAKVVELASINLDYALKAYELAEKRYEYGSLNSVDLLVFKNTYENQVLQYYEFLYNKLSTYLEIYRMSGKLSLEYVQN